MSLSGHSHSFDTGIAKELGLHCAIVYNHIIYWLRINAAKDQGIVNGKVWMYETQEQMANFLEYLSINEVKKAVVKLIESGILIKGNFNQNSFDKTNWYTVADQSIIQKSFTKAPCGSLDRSVRRDPMSPTAPCIYDKEDKEIRTNDDDDRVHARDEVLRTFDTKGNPKSSDIKAIIDQMRMKRFSDATIKEALKRTESSTDPISNVLKYVEQVCRQIDAQNEKELANNHQDKEKSWNKKINQKSKKFHSKKSSQEEDITAYKKPSTTCKENTTDLDMSVRPLANWRSLMP